MQKRLCYMSWAEVQSEMSIAGSPEKITNLGKDLIEKIFTVVNPKNPAELINIQFALKRIMAEITAEQRRYDKRTGQKTT